MLEIVKPRAAVKFPWGVVHQQDPLSGSSQGRGGLAHAAFLVRYRQNREP